MTNIGLPEHMALHASRQPEKATVLSDGGAGLARQAGLLAGQDLFWIVMWVGLAGAALLVLQRRASQGRKTCTARSRISGDAMGRSGGRPRPR